MAIKIVKIEEKIINHELLPHGDWILQAEIDYLLDSEYQVEIDGKPCTFDRIKVYTPYWWKGELVVKLANEKEIFEKFIVKKEVMEKVITATKKNNNLNKKGITNILIDILNDENDYMENLIDMQNEFLIEGENAMKTKLKSVYVEENLKISYDIDHLELKYPMIDRWTFLEDKATSHRSWGPFPYNILEIELESGHTVVVSTNDILESEKIYVHFKEAMDAEEYEIFKNKKGDEQVNLLDSVKKFLKKKKIEVENIDEYIEKEKSPMKEVTESDLPM